MAEPDAPGGDVSACDGSAFRLLGGRDESGGCAGLKGWKSKGGGNAVSVL